MSDSITIQNLFDFSIEKSDTAAVSIPGSELALYNDYQASCSLNVEGSNTNALRNPPLHAIMDLTKQNKVLSKPDSYNPTFQEKIFDRLQGKNLDYVKIFVFLLLEALLGCLIVYLANH